MSAARDLKLPIVQGLARDIKILLGGVSSVRITSDGYAFMC